MMKTCSFRSILFVIITAICDTKDRHFRHEQEKRNVTIEFLIYISNVGRSDLPDMYIQAQGHAVPEGECRHIRQIMSTHVTYDM